MVQGAQQATQAITGIQKSVIDLNLNLSRAPDLFNRIGQTTQTATGGLRGLAAVVSTQLTFDRLLRDINGMADGTTNLTNTLQTAAVLLLEIARIEMKGTSILALIKENKWTAGIIGLTAVASVIALIGSNSQKAAQEVSKMSAEWEKMRNAQNYSNLIGDPLGARRARASRSDALFNLGVDVAGGNYLGTTGAEFADIAGVSRAKLVNLLSPGYQNSLRSGEDPGVGGRLVAFRDYLNAQAEGESGIGPGGDLNAAYRVSTRPIPIEEQMRVIASLQHEATTAQRQGDPNTFANSLSKDVEMLRVSVQEREKLLALREAENQAAAQHVTLTSGERDQIVSTIELKQQLVRLDQVGNEVGATISNGFENALFSTNGLRAAVQGLLQDLERVAFRATAGQFIQDGMSSLFRGLAGPAINPATGGVAGGNYDVPMAADQARLTPSQRGGTMQSRIAGRLG
jgi:hypothetical protein